MGGQKGGVYPAHIMSSISSALIQATMSNVTRDMKQLEHWLTSLSMTAPSVPSEVSSATSDDIVRSLHDQQELLNQLKDTVRHFTTTLEAQQHTIHHLTDRIQILEESREPCAQETWMDPALVEEEEVPIYIVRKTEELAQEAQEEQEEAQEEDPVEVSAKKEEALVEVPVKQEEVLVKKEEVPVKQEEVLVKKEEVPVKKEEAPVEVPVKQEEAPVEVPVKQEEVPVKQEEVPVKQEEVPVKQESVEVPVKKEEAPVKQEPAKQEPAKQDPVEEEEEEEGMELEVIVFQGVSYYKDEEGFIYSIEEDEQPSEKAVGYWKKKAQAVAFYRSE